MLVAILFLAIALPIAWFVSEFHDNRVARILLGICAIGMSIGVAWIVGAIGSLQANTYFSRATKDLIQNTIIELENGRSDVVLTELRNLRDDFRPTYETRDEYDKIIEEYIHRISKSPVKHHAGDPLWSHEILD
ncbi:MAG: hypothetical protein MUC83_02795 [Pirellula sp.]|jgi:hypothetical protein|nr:hypothetical protein [Pirellula sp.]